MRKLLTYILLAIMVTSCGEYQRVLKSTDNDYKFEYAKRAFEQKRYSQSATILTDLVTVFKGSSKAEESLYLLAMSYYENKDYISSGAFFEKYYTRYPKGKYAEPARFYCGYGYYLDSPEPQLDQTGTIKAIREMQNFIDYFPRSEKVSTAQNAIFELQDKLTLKQLQNAQLYYNLGTYMGNNYESAVIVAKNAIKDYPYTSRREDFAILILRAKFALARLSIEAKKEERYHTAIDEYYGFVTEYPESKYMAEAKKLFRSARAYVPKDMLEEEATGSDAPAGNGGNNK